MIGGFTDHIFKSGETHIAYSRGGSGPPLLLLHGFPQTRTMWAEIAPALAQKYTVIAADLRGYGASSKPATVEEMSFRAMGQDQLHLMASLGFERFHLAGHDRGARTAHRIALDAPTRIASLVLMDIIPTHLLLSELSKEVASSYYHWFFLAQPEPFPERLILADPDFSMKRACWVGGLQSLMISRRISLRPIARPGAILKRSAACATTTEQPLPSISPMTLPI